MTGDIICSLKSAKIEYVRPASVAGRLFSLSCARAGPILVQREVTTTKRTYESLYIIDITSTDEQIQAVADKFSGVVTEQGGEVIAAGLWDKRRMAYDIKGKGEGCYLLMYFTGEAALCLELDRVMRISDDIIRHMILNIDPELVDITMIRKPGAEASAAPVEPVVEAVKPAEPVEVAEVAEAVEAVEPAEVAEVVEAVEVVEETPVPAVEVEPVAEVAEPVVEG